VVSSDVKKKKTDLGPPVVRVTPTVLEAANAFDLTEPRWTLAESDQTSVRPSGHAHVDLPPGSIVDDIYEVDARLGAGAMGEVYAARHTKLGKRVAIKVIRSRLSEDAAAIQRFALEARALAQIQHPAIVTVDHVGELADGRAYFVMEYLRGESLFERLQRGKLALEEALRVLGQVARGLEAAHAKGVTHRDLKPENIYLVHMPGEPPMVKLLDFGLAKLRADVGTDVGDDRDHSERTQSGVAIGTPLYMSPEQARGPDVDHRTDIYALGCVAYELVLGRSPFSHAKTVPELWAAHLHMTPALPRSIWPEIPPPLDLVLFAMLAKDPAQRPTLTQFRAVLAATSDNEQRAATEFVAQRPMPTSKNVATVVAATALLLAGILIGSMLTRPSAAPIPTAAAAPNISPIVSPIATPTPTSHAPPAAPIVPASVAPSASPPRHVVGEPRPHRPIPTTRSDGAGSGSARGARPDSPAETIDTGSAVPINQTRNPFAPIDRNQTVNPFTHKAPP
jgi:eukaryotic-like serine/threonine-protein kinase